MLPLAIPAITSVLGGALGFGALTSATATMTTVLPSMATLGSTLALARNAVTLANAAKAVQMASTAKKVADASLLIGGSYYAGKYVANKQHERAEAARRAAEADQRAQEEAAIAELRKVYPNASDAELRMLLQMMTKLEQSA